MVILINFIAMKSKDLINYSAPIIINNQQRATAIFFIPKKDFIEWEPSKLTFVEFLPVLLAIFLIVLLSLYIYRLIRKDVLAPLNSLHACASQILKGDFTYKSSYDYDTEIGEFCHDFEAMREEIRFSKEQEAKIKQSEKELLACISHDIKTPLTAIHGYVSGIKDGIVKDKPGIDNYCSIILY